MRTYKALTVRQPYADLLTRAVWRDEHGEYHARKTIEVRGQDTPYRGDVLICSSSAEVAGHDNGVTCGFVELYGIKPVAEFTPADWEATCIPEDERCKYRRGFGYLFRNPRRVVEMPAPGRLGMFAFRDIYGDITEYPRALALEEDGWKTVTKLQR